MKQVEGEGESWQPLGSFKPLDKLLVNGPPGKNPTINSKELFMNKANP